MLKWMSFLLKGGVVNGTRLVSLENLNLLFTPVIPLPPSAWVKPIFPASFSFQGYAMGWMVGNYREHLVLFHGGNIVGCSALVGGCVAANQHQIFDC